MIAGLLLVILLVAGFFIYRQYPNFEETKKEVYQLISDMDKGTFRRKGNTYIYDAEDRKIGRLGNENYTYVESSHISDYIKNGYIAQEDRRFASHHGIDIRGVTRAGLLYIKNKGKATQGGSTITQQVVKNNLLSQEKTMKRKVTEMLIALEMEKTYSKAQIMEFYCNSNYYGCGCYGVEGAAQYYFGHSAKELTLSEAAMLVGVSNRPNDYNPVADYQKALHKKNEVLANMLDQGFISKSEFDSAEQDKPKVVEKKDNTDNDNYMVSYAVHCATLQLMEQNGFQFQYDFPSQKSYKSYREKYSESYSKYSNLIRGGGYKIYTSFDQEIQNKLQKAVKDCIPSGLQGAAVCVDNQTQMVVAMSGGRTSKSQFNRGFLMERNPGSAIKPLLVYGPVLNEGIVTPGSKVIDEPLDIHGYRPKNADLTYRGTLTVREALARSVNTIAVKLLQETGPDTALPYLSNMHFSTLCYADRTILSTALGGFTNGVRVVDMAKGYATIANGGKYSTNNCLRKIIKEDGSTIYQCKDQQYEVYNKDTAFMLTDMMQGVFRESYGTAHKIYDNSQYYAGKTGTTNDNKDAWFCGFSSAYTTAVWAGCDTPKSVEGLKGASYPASVWMSFMKQIHTPKTDFSAPETVYLENDAGVEKNIKISSDIWKTRPRSFDYHSRLTEEKWKDKQRQDRIKEEIKQAEHTVSRFEDFQIENSKDAKNVENKYQKVLETIDAIENTSAQKSFKNRAAYKYELLSGEVKEKWQAVIAQEEVNAQKQKDIDNKKAAAKSEERAEEELEDKKEQIVEWYIDALNERTLYSDIVEKMITDANMALENCTGLSRYDELKEDLDKAIVYARSLPKKGESVTFPSLEDYPE